MRALEIRRGALLVSAVRHQMTLGMSIFHGNHISMSLSLSVRPHNVCAGVHYICGGNFEPLESAGKYNLTYSLLHHFITFIDDNIFNTWHIYRRLWGMPSKWFAGVYDATGILHHLHVLGCVANAKNMLVYLWINNKLIKASKLDAHMHRASTFSRNRIGIENGHNTSMAQRY